MKTIEQIAQFFNDSEYFTGSVKINENLAKHTTMNVGGNAKLFLEPKDGESLVFAVRYFIEENVKFFVLGGGSNVIISDAGLDAVISTRKMNQVKFLTEGTEDTESLIEGEKLLNPESPLCPPNLCIKFLTEGTEHTESLIEGKKLLESEISLCSPNLFEKFKNPLNPCESSLILEVDSGSSWGSVISFCKKNNLGGFESFSGLSGTVGGALFMNATCFGLSACDNLLSVRYFDLTDGKIHEYEKVDS
ncbi:MAG: FAD-binding protein, partial [Treponema sp.]|nr:FAD-binding protein [Treponema sp.]